MHYPEGGYYKRHFDVPAALQLDGRLRVSAFHPRDTFEIQTDSEGNRKWLMSLPHPMLHVVLASPPT